jgi:hypothetical protein
MMNAIDTMRDGRYERNDHVIQLQQDYEARDWAKSLGCTVGELFEAVKSVGSDADEVYRYLKRIG